MQQFMNGISSGFLSVGSPNNGGTLSPQIKVEINSRKAGETKTQDELFP